MSRLSVVVFFTFTLSAYGQAVSEWKPAAGPLFTKWGKEVDPAKVLPEHPRPQMMGRPWMNLNGLWEYCFAQNVAGQGDIRWKKILVPFPVESALSGVMRRHEGDHQVGLGVAELARQRRRRFTDGGSRILVLRQRRSPLHNGIVHPIIAPGWSRRRAPWFRAARPCRRDRW